MKKTFIAAALFSVWLAACAAAAEPAIELLESQLRKHQADANRPIRKDGEAQLKNVPQADSGPEQGYLGVVADDRKDRGRGVRIIELRPGGPADQAGLKLGDLITSLAGVRVRQMAEMAAILDRVPPGGKLGFEVLRQGEQKQITVTLGRRPSGKPPAQNPKPPQNDHPPLILPVPPADQPPAKPPAKPPVVDPVLEQRARIELLEQRLDRLEKQVAELERALLGWLKKQ